MAFSDTVGRLYQPIRYGIRVYAPIYKVLTGAPEYGHFFARAPTPATQGYHKMRMSKKAMAALQVAMSYHAWGREAWSAGNTDSAQSWDAGRDQYLKEAGLPDFDGLRAAFDEVYPGKPARATSPRAPMPDMVQSVRDFALAHYTRDGWDYLVECWSDDDIEEAIGNARTIAGAINACRKTVRLLNERRTEVENTVW